MDMSWLVSRWIYLVKYPVYRHDSYPYTTFANNCKSCTHDVAVVYRSYRPIDRVDLTQLLLLQLDCMSRGSFSTVLLLLCTVAVVIYLCFINTMQSKLKHGTELQWCEINEFNSSGLEFAIVFPFIYSLNDFCFCFSTPRHTVRLMLLRF